MKKKSVVLLSGGLDSTTNLYWAMQETDVVLALTFDYGQRAFEKEKEAASYFTQINKISHKIISVPWIRDWNKSSLINREETVPQGGAVSIDDMTISQQTAKSVWVPNRNGIFLNIAAGFAESLNADFIVPGFNLEEAQTFPDNSKDFLLATNHALSFSTSNKVKTWCYTITYNKTQIVKKALELKIPMNNLWFCYFSGSSWCGECESCLRAKRAFEANGVKFGSFHGTLA